MDLFHLLGAGAKFDRKRFKEDVEMFEVKVSGGSGSVGDNVESGADADAFSRELDFFGVQSGRGGGEVEAAKKQRSAIVLARETREAVDLTLAKEGVTPITSKVDADVCRRSFDIRVQGSQPPPPVRSLAELAVVFELRGFLRRSISALGFSQLTPVQMQGLPVLMQGRDLLAVAPTGSGKTLAFVVPILHSLKAPSRSGLRAVIVTPTRELASQIHRELLTLSTSKPFKVCLLTKRSVADEASISQLRAFDILISTPARLCHAVEHESLDLTSVLHLVLDEADKLLEEDSFLAQIDTIFAECTNDNLQKSMFSATMPSTIETLATSVMRDPIRLIIGNKEGATTTIDQKLTFVSDESGKLLAIRQLLTAGIKPPVLVFVQSIDRAKSLFNDLVYENINVDVIHSGRTKLQRDNIISNFRRGNIWVLICTELMGRGIDFKGVNLVLNYDFPQSVQSYVHRIGRTGRANRKGTAITYFTKSDAPYLKMIANVMKQSNCVVPDWMLSIQNPTKQMKKRLKTRPVVRQGISEPSDWDKKKTAKRKLMIDASKKREGKKLNTADSFAK